MGHAKHWAEPSSEPVRALVGESSAIKSLLERVTSVARSDAPVLLSGESGTGKELVARTLHEQSPRRSQAFVAVNCAAFPETLLEAELFGYERGAFTGALKRREGRFQAANQGTLLLDEVAEMPLSAQAKLLRVLEEGTFEPLGTNESVSVNVRVISATHQNLKERITLGLFREDLYYRLNVLDIKLPPLRARRDDIPVLIEHFLRKHNPPGMPLATVSPKAFERLITYDYPGNVRELMHALEHALVLSGGRDIDLMHLPVDLLGESVSEDAPKTGLMPLQSALKDFERGYLLRALNLAEGNRTRAAELLGISRKNLWEKLRAHQVSEHEVKAVRH